MPQYPRQPTDTPHTATSRPSLLPLQCEMRTQRQQNRTQPRGGRRARPGLRHGWAWRTPCRLEHTRHRRTDTARLHLRGAPRVSKGVETPSYQGTEGQTRGITVQRDRGSVWDGEQAPETGAVTAAQRRDALAPAACPPTAMKMVTLASRVLGHLHRVQARHSHTVPLVCSSSLGLGTATRRGSTAPQRSLLKPLGDGAEGSSKRARAGQGTFAQLRSDWAKAGTLAGARTVTLSDRRFMRQVALAHSSSGVCSTPLGGHGHPCKTWMKQVQHKSP